ncbi:condensation domain-containing protein, partial [Mycolicibacterium elephantis]
MALSPLQQGLYSLAKLSADDGGDPYVIAMAADISGTLDTALLRDCAAAMLARHPNLRASFVQANPGRPVQVVPTRVEVPWRQIAATDDEVDALEADERRRPFDLERGPAIRFLLVELPRERWRFIVVAHHIIIDGWSLPLFVGELITLYRSGGDPAALPPPPRPYRDYIGWLANRDREASRALWREHLDGLDGPTLLTPALTAGEPPVGTPRRTELKLDRETTAALADAARSRGVTVNTLMQMAWATLLSACTDRSDVVFGVTVSGRPGELTGVETMVGLFINTVPLRVRLDPVASVGAQCLAVQREAALLRDHSYVPHAELRALGGIGEMFDTLLVYENFPPGGLVGGGAFSANGATFRPAALESLSHFPVTIAAHMVDDQLT